MKCTINLIGCLLAALMLVCTTASAQPYSGGNNSGAVVAGTGSSCNAGRFAGGSNAGSIAVAGLFTTCITDRFYGAAGAGTIAVATQLVDCTNLRFAGDTTDGNANAYTNTLDCTPLRFSGDTNSGGVAAVTSLLQCTNNRFFGDTGSGYSSKKLLVIRQFLGSDTSLVLICSNETFSLLTLYNAEGLSYNWNTANPAAATTGTYQLIATNQAGCVDTAMATLKQVISRWTGAISSNWHDAGNWSDGKIPGAQTHVIINTAAVNPCEISDADAIAASVQALQTAVFRIINNRVLRITANCVSLPGL